MTPRTGPESWRHAETCDALVRDPDLRVIGLPCTCELDSLPDLLSELAQLREQRELIAEAESLLASLGAQYVPAANCTPTAKRAHDVWQKLDAALSRSTQGAPKEDEG